MARRLAAILAADVVGYSRLMGADEAGTLAALRTHREELIGPKVAAHDGRIVKLMGDGMLAEFPSAVEAVLCAVEIQRGLAERNLSVPEEQQIQFRIGVNLGDVISEGDDIYGDGVNVAARLEELSNPGGICLSSTVHLQVQNKIDVGFQDLGEKELKNIAYPVHVFGILPDGEMTPALQTTKAWTRKRAIQFAGLLLVAAILVSGGYFGWLKLRPPDTQPASIERMALPLPDKPSIAVLPFSNMSGDPEQDYFADGMTEDIITGLSHFKDLFVVARNSVFTYKNAPVKVQDVSEALGVRYVLEGSVRKVGNNVRITAQLVDAIAGNHLWAKKFDRELTDVFAVQDEITQEIVATIGTIGGVGGLLQQAEMQRAASKPPESLAAYDYFLKAEVHIDNFTKNDIKLARQAFQKAIRLDPNYAKAFAGLAWTYLIDYLMGWAESPDDTLQQAREASEDGIAANESESWAHWAMATVYGIELNHDRALAEYEKALALNPNDADIVTEYGWMLAYSGRAEEGVTWIEKAMRLNPHYPSWYTADLGQVLYLAGRYEEAIAAYDSYPSSEYTASEHVYRAASFMELGRKDEAREELTKALAADPNTNLQVWARRPIKNQEQRQSFLNALREAGMPE